MSGCFSAIRRDHRLVVYLIQLRLRHIVLRKNKYDYFCHSERSEESLQTRRDRHPCLSVLDNVSTNRDSSSLSLLRMTYLLQLRRRYSPSGSDSASASQRCPPDTRTPSLCTLHFALCTSPTTFNLTVKQMLCFAFTLTNKQKRGKMYNCKIL